MKKLLVAVSVAAFAFAGCSKNETFDSPKGDVDAIAFGSYAHLTSRGTPVNNNAEFSAVGKAFGLVAFFNGAGASAKPYLGTGEGTPASPAGAITVTSDGTNWTYPDVKYWPSSALDFYAYAPHTDDHATRAFSLTQAEVKVDYTVPDVIANQEDFMVAALWNKTKSDVAADNKLPMPFRHALTQVVFKFANSSATLEIEVSGIKVNNAVKEGTFTFQTISTPEYGTWMQKTATSNYEQNLKSTLTLSGVTPLPTNPVEMTGDEVMMLLPQGSTTPWNPAQPANGGTSIDISCIIKDKDSGIVLWGNGSQEAPTAKALRIGVSFSDWAMGKRVIYCITFGNEGGTAGNDPTTGNAVLLPILFSSSVVGWGDTNHNLDI